MPGTVWQVVDSRARQQGKANWSRQFCRVSLKSHLQVKPGCFGQHVTVSLASYTKRHGAYLPTMWLAALESLMPPENWGHIGFTYSDGLADYSRLPPAFSVTDEVLSLAITPLANASTSSADLPYWWLLRVSQVIADFPDKVTSDQTLIAFCVYARRMARHLSGTDQQQLPYAVDTVQHQPYLSEVFRLMLMLRLTTLPASPPGFTAQLSENTTPLWQILEIMARNLLNTTATSTPHPANAAVLLQDAMRLLVEMTSASVKQQMRSKCKGSTWRLSVCFKLCTALLHAKVAVAAGCAHDVVTAEIVKQGKLATCHSTAHPHSCLL